MHRELGVSPTPTAFTATVGHNGVEPLITTALITHHRGLPLQGEQYNPVAVA